MFEYQNIFDIGRGKFRPVAETENTLSNNNDCQVECVRIPLQDTDHIRILWCN